jgi:hypothetical protein
LTGSQSRNGATLLITEEGRSFSTLPRIDGNQEATIPTLKWEILSPVSARGIDLKEEAEGGRCAY